MMSFNDIFPVDDAVHVDNVVVTERQFRCLQPQAPTNFLKLELFEGAVLFSANSTSVFFLQIGEAS